MKSYTHHVAFGLAWLLVGALFLVVPTRAQQCLPGAVSYIGCYIDTQGYISDLAFYSTNPQQQSTVCGSDDTQLLRTRRVAIHKSVGEVITSIEVCTDGGGVRGVELRTSLAQSYECGRTGRVNGLKCRTLSGGLGDGHALSGLSGLCTTAGGINRLQRLDSPCWNYNYVQPASQVCAPGSGTPGGGLPCRLCLPGEFGAGGPYPCSKCPPGSTSLTAGSTTCGCLPGYGVSNTHDFQCRQCAPGWFAVGGSLSRCEPCPSNLTSLAGAPSAAHCTCKPGYGFSGGECQICAVGSYSPGPIAARLTPQSLPDNRTQCDLCELSGFVALSAAIEATTAAAVQPQPAACQPCGPGLRTAGEGATSKNDCAFNPGPAPSPSPSPRPIPIPNKSNACILCKPQSIADEISARCFDDPTSQIFVDDDCEGVGGAPFINFSYRSDTPGLVDIAGLMQCSVAVTVSEFTLRVKDFDQSCDDLTFDVYGFGT